MYHQHIRGALCTGSAVKQAVELPLNDHCHQDRPKNFKEHKYAAARNPIK